MKKIKAKQAYLADLKFQMCPVDAGQIVEVTYAADEDGVWCRTYDRSDRTTTYQFAAYPARASESALRHEPWNGIIAAHNSWRDVEVA